ncbi:MAG: beta-lactamase family protein [Planctomycetales bacterium]|nr:beta-lactamase family protein [Planctomycetales bacterium]
MKFAMNLAVTCRADHQAKALGSWSRRHCRPAPPSQAPLHVISLAVVAMAGLLSATAALAETPVTPPELVGMNGERLRGLSELVEQGIAEKKMPGCVVCVGRHGKIVYLEAFGLKKIAPDPEPMRTDTLFDMASITKPVATATSVMRLAEAGRFRLDDRVEKFFPEFGVHGKDEITVRHLLIHQSGLIPDNALSDYRDGPEKAWEKICALELVAPVGEAFKYSDVNFIVLGKLVEKVSGQTLHEFSRDQIFKPLEMHETGYLPAESLAARAAPTEKREGKWMRGEVHDPRAHLLGGVAGHAGLFSTATDLSLYARMMLGNGRLPGGARVLAPRTVEAMTAPQTVSSGIRGLGWDKQTGYSSNRGDFLTSAAFGHGGFTGTVLWIDPELDLFFIFLSNRVHPNGKGSVNHLAGQIVNRVVGSITDR